MTFDREKGADLFRPGFRALNVLNEVKLLPGKKLKLQPGIHSESITHVREGRMLDRHRPGREAVLGSGYCQRTNTNRGLITGKGDLVPSQGAHLFISAMTLHGDEAASTCESRHYPFADRRGTLRLIASPDGSVASLRLQHDVRIYSSVLDPGHHVVHELSQGRGAWLHVIAGRVRLLDQILATGDGASLDDEPALSLTAQESSEILLFDLA